MPIRAVAIAIAASSSPGSRTAVGLLPASGVSAGSTYEVVTALDGTKHIQLKRYTTYTTARASARTGTEWGRTWANGSALDSADQNTTVANAFHWNHGATATDWVGGTYSGPHYYHTVTILPGDRLEYTLRAASNGDANYEMFGIGVCLNSATSSYSTLRMGWSNAAVSVGVQVDDSIYTTPIGVATTSGQRDAGIWLRVVIDSSIHHYYSTANQATPPTAWTRVRTPNVSTTTAWWVGQALRVGIHMMSGNTSNSFTGSVLYEDLCFTSGESGRTGIQSGAVLLDTGAAEQLIGEIDFGADVSLDQTVLRQVLADAVNTRPSDSATVTWSVVSGSSAAPASGTYYAAGSVVAPAAGRYVRVYAKIASATGAEQGSIKLPLLLPATT